MFSNTAQSLKQYTTTQCHVLDFIRHESTARHFYQNRQLEVYASREAKRLTLRQLVFFGRHMNEERLIKSANYVRTELPVRIAHRLRDLQTLPYVVVTQEGVARVYELYWSAFEKWLDFYKDHNVISHFSLARFRRYPPITTLPENDRFCDFVGGLLNEHATVIPNLSLGLSLSSPYLAPDELDSVMRRMLISRISRRVLAEHHIALTEIYNGRRKKEASGEPHVGIIFTGLKVKKSIEHCVKLLRQRPTWIEDLSREEVHVRHWPEVIIDGQLDTRFPYIKEHLEYIVFELLKNSMRATLLAHPNNSSLPPIRATIAAGENDVGIRISDQGSGLFPSESQIKQPADLFSFSHLRNATRMEHSRIGALRSASTSEEGVRATVAEQVDRWNHAKPQGAPSCAVGIETHPRIGIGLPMSNIFATYFGGSLDLVSLDGWGTDVYLRLPKLGTNLEGIEV